MLDLDSINTGFSRKALVYDEYGADHPAIQWTRAQVYMRVLAVAAPGASLLELNAGTGADAARLAERGFRVHATDLADGMVAAIRDKIEARGLHDRLTAQQCSFTEPQFIQGGPYDVILSNFGGLNCVPDLSLVVRGLPRLLKPGGHVIAVVMPPVCPWELAQALRGRFNVAFRRLRRAVLAHVEGAHFITYYFSPAEVQRAFGEDFATVHLQSLSLFSPPAFMDGFPRRFPRLFRWLTALDARLTPHPPFNALGDFFVLTLRYHPAC